MREPRDISPEIHRLLYRTSEFLAIKWFDYIAVRMVFIGFHDVRRRFGAREYNDRNTFQMLLLLYDLQQDFPVDPWHVQIEENQLRCDYITEVALFEQIVQCLPPVVGHGDIAHRNFVLQCLPDHVHISFVVLNQ